MKAVACISGDIAYVEQTIGGVVADPSGALRRIASLYGRDQSDVCSKIATVKVQFGGPKCVPSNQISELLRKELSWIRGNPPES
jgi:hypothetical protein